jgi:hypothetical protein
MNWSLVPPLLGLGLFLVSLYLFAQAHTMNKEANHSNPSRTPFNLPTDLLESIEGNNRTDGFLKRKGQSVDALMTLVETQARAPPLSVGTLHERYEGILELKNATNFVIQRLGTVFEQRKMNFMGAVQGLEVLQRVSNVLSDQLIKYLPAAVGDNDWGQNAADGLYTGQSSKANGTLVVSVTERPFGMHVRDGTTLVEEVFPGFPARRLGIKRGCTIQTIAGKHVDAGTWLEAFRHSKLPFELVLHCGKQPFNTDLHISEDPHFYRALVLKKPFGMNVQVNHLPRVIEVLPGFPAEAAGIKRGMVVTEVNNQPVNDKTWFQAFDKAVPPFTLTFDTTVPIHADNPYFFKNPSTDHEALVNMSDLAHSHGTHGEPLIPLELEAFKDAKEEAKKLPAIDWSKHDPWQCTVNEVPFGMQIQSKPGTRPLVSKVLSAFPANKEGVHVNDILLEVAGVAVNSDNWFSYFQQANPPFGLKFARKKLGQ